MSDVREKPLLTPLLKARDTFERFIGHLETEQERAGAIQAFEYCYELAWKTMKRLLALQGIEVNSPRSAFRQAALNNLIADPEVWFDFIVRRNITAHTYNEEAADEIVAILPFFLRELDSFIANIKSQP